MAFISQWNSFLYFVMFGAKTEKQFALGDVEIGRKNNFINGWAGDKIA